MRLNYTGIRLKTAIPLFIHCIRGTGQVPYHTKSLAPELTWWSGSVLNLVLALILTLALALFSCFLPLVFFFSSFRADHTRLYPTILASRSLLYPLVILRPTLAIQDNPELRARFPPDPSP